MQRQVRIRGFVPLESRPCRFCVLAVGGVERIAIPCQGTREVLLRLAGYFLRGGAARAMAAAVAVVSRQEAIRLVSQEGLAVAVVIPHLAAVAEQGGIQGLVVRVGAVFQTDLAGLAGLVEGVGLHILRLLPWREAEGG